MGTCECCHTEGVWISEDNLCESCMMDHYKMHADEYSTDGITNEKGELL